MREGAEGREDMAARGLVALQAEQDQDECNAVTWWKETSDDAKSEIWLRIQNMGGSDEMEIISRMAQLGMTRVCLLADEKSNV